MNDLTLNKAVAKKLGYSFTNALGGLDNQTTIYISDEEVHNMDVDYCNRWADAGPIIEKYKIDMKHREGAWYACFSDKDHLVITDDKSALKAAMLCFLEMEINDDK